MNYILKFTLLALVATGLSSCVSKKKFNAQESALNNTRTELDNKRKELADCNKALKGMDQRINSSNSQAELDKGALKAKEQQVADLKSQIEDLRKQRTEQYSQVKDLTILSKEANANIGKTIDQLESKDRYISLLQRTKSKSDSMNLALAINLKGVLRDGLLDEDIDVKVDKTVVFIDLSDKMLYNNGSSTIKSEAKNVLEKIARIVKSRPDVEVMVEGYTDNKSIQTSCLDDNWDLSVKRATSVVRVLEKEYGVDPNRLIAAGRGENNPKADNSTEEGRKINRRTRIILLPKIDQFYELLEPKNMPK